MVASAPAVRFSGAGDRRMVVSHIVQPKGPPKVHDRCVAIAQRWLTACSKSSCEYKSEALTAFTDEQLAEKCICSWGLDQPQGDENDITWFEANGADREMLVRAFAEVRAVLIGRTSDV